MNRLPIFTEQGPLRVDLSGLSDEHDVAACVAVLAGAGVRAFHAGESPACGKGVGRGFARGLEQEGVLAPTGLSVSVPVDADLSSHSGVARGVERALNAAGVRRAGALLLPWSAELWSGQLSATLAALREVSLFQRVIMRAPDEDAASQALSLHGVDAVRLDPEPASGWPGAELLDAARERDKLVEAATGAEAAPGPEAPLAHEALVAVLAVADVQEAGKLAGVLADALGPEGRVDLATLLRST